MEKVTARGLTFDVLTRGPVDGIPVMCLHGWPESARSFEPVADLLAARGYRVMAPLQRGYSEGARPTDVADYRIEELRADIIAIAAECGHESFHLVGHDWGASVAWSLAAYEPDRILSLTAISIPHLAAFGVALKSDPEQREKSSYIGLLRTAGKAEDVLLANDAATLRAMYQGHVDATLVDEHVAMLSTPGALTATLNWYRAMGRELNETPKVSVPTTFVWGNQDLAVAASGAHATADYVTADYLFIEIPDGHWLLGRQSDAVAEAIAARIASAGEPN